MREMFNFWAWSRAEKLIEKYDKLETGLVIKYDKGINSDVKKAVEKLEKWLIKEECWFPVKLTIYVEKGEKVIASNGEEVYSLEYFSYDFRDDFYIKIATGDYEDILKERQNKNDALAPYIYDIIKSLTFYYQWINGFRRPWFLKRINAKKYADYIFDDYVRDNKTAI